MQMTTIAISALSKKYFDTTFSAGMRPNYRAKNTSALGKNRFLPPHGKQEMYNVIGRDPFISQLNSCN
jgi:hypothetical protein